LLALIAAASGFLFSVNAGESATSVPLDGQFTNELGRAVTLSEFRGQALAITFIYTRCPMPQFCPRLSKNFQEVSAKLAAMTNGPVNWHLLSVTFDPATDTPSVLKAYGERYAYDAEHWSFLTGAPEQISALARSAGVSYKPNGGMVDHNFRTLIIDPAGRLQMVFPTSGDLSDQIVEQILKAAAVTNKLATLNQP
jgi:protein SCO1/2